MLNQVHHVVLLNFLQLANASVIQLLFLVLPFLLNSCHLLGFGVEEK